MVLEFLRGRFWRVALGSVFFGVMTASSQAVYFVNHFFTNLTPSTSISDLILFDSDGFFDSLTYTYSAVSPSATISTGPYLDMATRTSFIGLTGGSVAVGLNSSSAASAIGQSFSTFFGFSEATIQAAVLNITTGSDVSAGQTVLFSFFAANATKLYNVGDALSGKVMKFTGGEEIGTYESTVTDAPVSVPEPFTMALGAAAAGLGAMRMRRRAPTR